MLNEKFVNIILFISLIIYFRGYFTHRYFFIIPTISVYPDNEQEILKVNHYVNQNNKYYLDLFKETDITVAEAFKKIVDLPRKKLENIVLSKHVIIITLLLKTIINRARPIQINSNLNIQDSVSAHTPAYPSGHCIQAYYLAKKLCILYPEKTDILFKLAEDCALSRVYAGLHYPSDNEFGKYIALNIL